MTTTVHLRGPQGEKGIALVAALLIVMLVAIVGATFMLTVSNERSMSSNVQVSRDALLAADAGVRVTQQVLANQAKTTLDNLVATHTGTGPIITSPSTLFPSLPQTITSTSPQFSATATIVFVNQVVGTDAQTYDYRYTITSNGNSGAQGVRQVQSTGTLRVSAQRGSFADYLMFISAPGTSGGTPLWINTSMHFDGRVHTNGEFHFAYQPRFDDMVTSVNGKAWFWNNGSPQEAAASTYGAFDAPQFFGGFVRGAAQVDLPTNTDEQLAGAVGLAAGTPPNAANISTALGGAPSNNTVYLPNDGAGHLTGGIFVQGTVSSLTMEADTVLHVQRYTIVQPNGTTTVTVNLATGTSVRDVSGTTTNYNAEVPNGQIYVAGGIDNLQGPARIAGLAPPAVGAGQQLLVTATNDIVIQGDLTCENFSAATNVLGIYSGTGSVRVGSSAPNNLNLDAFVFANGASGAFGVDGYDSGAPRGTLHLRGGVVERFYGPFSIIDGSGNPTSGYFFDGHYDRRGIIPPLYPKTPAGAFHVEQPTAKTLAWKEL